MIRGAALVAPTDSRVAPDVFKFSKSSMVTIPRYQSMFSVSKPKLTSEDPLWREILHTMSGELLYLV
jgi:hypothetical protein